MVIHKFDSTWLSVGSFKYIAFITHCTLKHTYWPLCGFHLCCILQFYIIPTIVSGITVCLSLDYLFLQNIFYALASTQFTYYCSVCMRTPVKSFQKKLMVFRNDKIVVTTGRLIFTTRLRAPCGKPWFNAKVACHVTTAG